MPRLRDIDLEKDGMRNICRRAFELLAQGLSWNVVAMRLGCSRRMAAYYARRWSDACSGGADGV